jgi:hypothetical protein
MLIWLLLISHRSRFALHPPAFALPDYAPVVATEFAPVELNHRVA